MGCLRRQKPTPSKAHFADNQEDTSVLGTEIPEAIMDRVEILSATFSGLLDKEARLYP